MKHFACTYIFCIRLETHLKNETLFAISLLLPLKVGLNAWFNSFKFKIIYEFQFLDPQYARDCLFELNDTFTLIN